MVTSAAGRSGGSCALAAANRSGSVLYAEASQPSPWRATLRSPAGDPQLASQTGIGLLGGGASGEGGGG